MIRDVRHIVGSARLNNQKLLLISETFEIYGNVSVCAPAIDFATKREKNGVYNSNDA